MKKLSPHIAPVSSHDPDNFFSEGWKPEPFPKENKKDILGRVDQTRSVECTHKFPVQNFPVKGNGEEILQRLEWFGNSIGDFLNLKQQTPPFHDNCAYVQLRKSEILVCTPEITDGTTPIYGSEKKEITFGMNPENFEEYFVTALESLFVERYLPFSIYIHKSLCAFDISLFSKKHLFGNFRKEKRDFYLVSIDHMSNPLSIVGCAYRALKKTTEGKPILKGLKQQYFALFFKEKGMFVIGKIPL